MTTILNSNILELGFLLGFGVFQLGFWVLKNPKTHLKNPKTQVGWVFRKTHIGGSTLITIHWQNMRYNLTEIWLFISWEFFYWFSHKVHLSDPYSPAELEKVVFFMSMLIRNILENRNFSRNIWGKVWKMSLGKYIRFSM